MLFWLLGCKEFKGFVSDDFLRRWSGCLCRGRRRGKPMEKWKPPDSGCHKFNIDGAARGKTKLAGTWDVLQNNQGNISNFFRERIGIKESNEAELLAIKRALSLWIYEDCVPGSLIVEGGDSRNVIACLLV